MRPRVSSVVRLLTGFGESLRRDSLDSWRIRSPRSRLQASWLNFFCTSRLVCLTRRCARFCERPSFAPARHCLRSRKVGCAEKLYIIGVF